MEMLTCINDFVETMEREKERFENTQNEISRREEEVAQVLENLKRNESQIIEAIKKQIVEIKDENIEVIFNQTSGTIEKTIAETGDRITEAVKGMKFIQDFEKHFTVSVFGKVKAGKSYIGNFIMGQPLRSCGIESAYDKLEDLTVHVYDRGKMYTQGKLSTFDEEKECNGKEFYVNEKEATSTIQYVNIGGMCWFDTPGIGSVTHQNEELAKEYVKNSDLVIFACNSAAAGTRQEFDEIGKLHEMRKPLLLLLTQSDDYEVDVDDDGNEISELVPKSEKDRRDVEKYMLDTLEEQGLADVLKYADILTVSAYLATEAIKNQNEEMFAQSNMGLLLQKLKDITQNDAADIKRNTPKSRINEMIDGIVRDLSAMRDEISKICAGIEESKRELINRKDWMVEQIRAAVNIQVQDIVAQAKAKVEKEKASISEEQMAAQINQAIQNCVQKICTEEALQRGNKKMELHIQLSGIGDMKMKQESIAYEYTSVHSIPRAPKGVIENIGSVVFKKEYYTSETRSETRYSVFDVGVNDVEIANNILLQLNKVFAETVEDYIEHLTKGYYEPVENLQEQTINEINTEIEALMAMRM